MLRVELNSAHLRKDSAQGFLVICGEQVAVLVNMHVEVFDHLWVVPLMVFLGAHGHAKHHHVASSDNFVHILVHSLQEGVVEKLVPNPDPLTLVK